MSKHLALSEKYPYLELFWPVFSGIRTEYGEILHISPFSVRIQENADQNNFEYGHFLRSVVLFWNRKLVLYCIIFRVIPQDLALLYMYCTLTLENILSPALLLLLLLF